MSLTRTIALSTLILAGCANAAQDDSPPLPATAAVAVVAAPTRAAESEPEINPGLLRRFKPLSDDFNADQDPVVESKIQLGRMLFHDPRLSSDGDISCNSCHDLERYGVDGQPTSRGTKGQLGKRNSPTVYNAAGFFLQFWDGRATTVEDQAKGPILALAEMGMAGGAQVVAKLKRVPGYVTAFHASFPGEKDPVTFDNVAKAIGTFERKLVTPGRWDKFLLGDKSALTRDEKVGLKTFLDSGCMVCHTGNMLGGSMFQKVGASVPWPNQADTGRMEVTKNEGDRMMFKVPTLRNVEKTAPYFHDASAATLEEAVTKMAKHQLGVEMPEQDVLAIVTWLKSLTGDLPRAYAAKPTLPPAE